MFAGSPLFSTFMRPALASAQPPPPKDSRFPEGAGRAAFLSTCSECHGAETVIAELKTRDEWRKTLDNMASNGAQATDEDWKQILEYLDTNFSLILVNTADAARLARTLGVPQSDADAIVRYREEHGRFATLEDLKKVPGADAGRLDARKDRFVF
jgi:competence protein ComEA